MPELRRILRIMYDLINFGLVGEDIKRERIALTELRGLCETCIKLLDKDNINGQSEKGSHQRRS